MNSTIPRKEVDPIRELIPWARHDAILKAFDEREKERKEILKMVKNLQDASLLPEKVKEIIGVMN